MKNAREVALKTLYDIEYENAYSNLAIKKRLSEAQLSTVDKALATALVYGVIQRRNTLEYIISRHSKIKLNKISKYVMLILKLGIYQLLFMDRIPESAAVNESVKLARKYSHQSGTGFVNGVLRNVAREGKDYPLPKSEKESLSIKYSYPEWLVDEWVRDYGKEFACELMDAMNGNPKVSIRVNSIKATTDELIKKLGGSRGRYMNEALYVSGLDIGESKEYMEGLFSVQDEAAMMSSFLLGAKQGDVVLDMCAAPGGKTTHIAELMSNKGRVIAFDIHEHKIKLIEENKKRLGLDIIEAKLMDATLFNEDLIEKADKILVDAPCSGLGIIRRKPDIKWNKNKDDELSKIQYSILENASKYLKKGGELVYSTCTLRKSENEEIIKRFISENNDFEMVDLGGSIDGLLKDTMKDGYFTLYPNIDGTDGFFIAKMKKV